MTEPQAGSDPTLFTTRAVKDGDEWVINGWKFFSSNAKTASFFIVMVVTNPDVEVYRGMSMFLVPADTPGVNIVRNLGLGGEPPNEGSHALIHYENVRVPAERCSAAKARRSRSRRPGSAAVASTTRCARSGMAQKALDMMCERALSRHDAGLAARRQAVRAGLHRRLLRAARRSSGCSCCTSRGRSTSTTTTCKVRKDIAAIKVLMPTVLHDIAWRAMQVHGALGVSNEMPFSEHAARRQRHGPRRWPTEVHKVTVAKQVLRDYKPSDDLWPTRGTSRSDVRRRRRSTPSSSNTRWATCDRPDLPTASMPTG